MSPAQQRQNLEILGYVIGTYGGEDKIDDGLCFIFYEFEHNGGIFGNEKFPPGVKDFTVDFHTGEYWFDDDNAKVLKYGKIVELISFFSTVVEMQNESTAMEIIKIFN